VLVLIVVVVVLPIVLVRLGSSRMGTWSPCKWCRRATRGGGVRPMAVTVATSEVEEVDIFGPGGVSQGTTY
jgi:hypothetical protein